MSLKFENYLTAEKKNYQNVDSNLKIYVFNTIYLIVKDYQISKFLSIFTNIVNFLLILSFCFHKKVVLKKKEFYFIFKQINKKVNSIWNGKKISNYLEIFFKYLHFEEFFLLFSWNTYIFLFYFFFGILILTILYIIYISYAFNHRKKLMSWPLFLIKTNLFFFTNIFFYPFFHFYLSIFDCKNKNSQLVHSKYENVICWESIHIFHGVIAFFSCINFLIISFFFSLTFFQNSFCSTDISARFFYLFL